MPSEPVSIAARSESRSPNRLSVTITSNCFGQRVSCMAPASAYMWLSSTSGYSASCTSVTTWRQSTPELHDVGLLHRADLVLPPPRQLEGRARDAGDLALGVALGVDADALVALGEDAARLAEVDAGGQLAHDHDVEPGHHLALQRGEVGERVEALRRAQVGVEVHLLAQPQQPALGLHREVEVVVLRPADRAEQHRVRRLRPRHRRVGQRRAVARRRRSRRPGPPRPRTAGRCAPNQSMTLRTSAITSGPMPSPGRISRVGAGMAGPPGWGGRACGSGSARTGQAGRGLRRGR